MNVRSILVPLDGSPFGETALPLASKLARGAGARIRLVLVHSSTPGVGLGGEGVAIGTSVREREAAYLAGTAERLDPGGALPVEVVHPEGHPGAALTAEAAQGRDDLIVMATHGRGALSRMWLGSVTDYLVRHVTIPLLLVRPDGESPVYGRTDLTHALVPLDLSEAAEAILDPALTVLRLGSESGRDTRVTLLAVVEPVLGVGEPGLPTPVLPDPRLLEEQRRVAEHRLEEVAQPLRTDGVRVETRVVSGARAAAAILELSEQNAVNLIALTTHGAGGLRRVLLGSVADKVIRGAHVPVLVLRPGEPGDAG